MLGRLKFDIEELVEAILDQLPEHIWESETTTFLDPAIGGGQFVVAIERRLRKYGHSSENIAKRVFGYEDNILRINYAINKNKLVGNYQAKEFLKEEFSMKFDVVVGNPPFQSNKKNSDQLWPLFSDKAIRITKEGGFTAMIIPDSWTSGTKSVMLEGRKNLLSDVLKNYTVKLLNFDIKKFFPKVGSGFSLFILNKDSPSEDHLTKIFSQHGTFDFDISKLNYIPKEVTHITLSIASKISASSGNKVYFKFYGKVENLNLVEISDSTHRYEYFNNSSNHTTLWGNVSGQGYGKKKVMYTYMGSRPKFGYDITGNISMMYNGRAFEVPDDATIAGLQSYFESKLVSFINRDKWSQYNEPKILNLLPIVDFSRVWTDQEIYDHFGLTQEEIDYIEENVK